MTLVKETETVQSFKNELKKYQFYRKSRIRYRQNLEVIIHHEEGIFGIDTTKERVQGSSDPSIKNLKRLQLIEDKEKTEALIERCETKIKAIDKALSEMDINVANILKRVYIEQKTTLDSESNKLNYSKRHLIRIINDEIAALDENTLEIVLI